MDSLSRYNICCIWFNSFKKIKSSIVYSLTTMELRQRSVNQALLKSSNIYEFKNILLGETSTLVKMTSYFSYSSHYVQLKLGDYIQNKHKKAIQGKKEESRPGGDLRNKEQQDEEYPGFCFCLIDTSLATEEVSKLKMSKSTDKKIKSSNR